MQVAKVVGLAPRMVLAEVVELDLVELKAILDQFGY